MLRVLPLLLLAAPLAAADPAPEPKRVPDVAAFPTAFAAAVGGHFEFLGGETGTTRGHAGSAAADRFWFAKVRATAPGRYVLAYSVRFEYPAAVTAKWRMPTEAEYVFRVAVGKAGERRVFAPGGYGGSAFPHACVGDTLLVPVHADPYRVDHRFEPVKKVADDDPQFRILAERADERSLKDAANPPVVRNAAADRLKLVGSWVSSIGNRPGTATHHSLTAYLEFTAPGTFGLAGRLAAPAGPGREAVPFRVVPAGRPVTAALESFGYTQTKGIGKSHMTSTVPPGTLEARVGDRVGVGCGGYGTGGLTPPDPTKTGVVEALPFQDVAAYQPR